MKPHAGKIPKACDPCRRRKTRCNGQRPCQNCHEEPAVCSYRTKARNRQRKAPAPAPPESAAAPTAAGQTTRPDAISAASRSSPRHDYEEHDTCPGSSGQDGVVATDADDSQIYYGPSSNYALAQHIRRILHPHAPPTPTATTGSPGTQDVSAVLDVYMQRHLYFGPPRRADAFAAPLLDDNGRITEILPRLTATRFLDSFKLATLHLLPFFTCQSLDILLDKMYVGGSEEEPSSQRRALLLVALAIGALSETETTLAETIFLAAKQENELRDDAMSLESIQFSLLAADFQINLGRGTSAYLDIGTACRKAFAMGLPVVSNNAPSHEGQDEQRRVTVWVAYFMDSWYSIMGGRKRMITTGDITCQRPKEHAFLTNLCQIATFLEEMADLIHDGKPKPLRDLYKSASNIYTRLSAWADGVGIGSVATGRQRPSSETLALLTLHNAYFQTIQFIFRPFIVAEYALQNAARETSELWLRHACRYATDAAIDCIVFFRSMFQTMDLQKLRRRDAYFLEISCSLLLLESLRHPSKHAHNAIYIDAALAILNKMPADVPITTLTQSTKSIAEAVGSFIAHRRIRAASRLSPLATPSSTADINPADSLMRFDAASVDDELQLSMGNQVFDSSDMDKESFLSSLSHEEISAMMVHPFDFSML